MNEVSIRDIMTTNTQEIVIAQFSDSHLFANVNGLHHGVNVFTHLKQVLANIASNNSIDYVIFTGDLTQDHSEASYQLFADAVRDSQLTAPVYFLAGNHDDVALLNQYLSAEPFCDKKQITQENWQVLLLNSKSENPAGFVSEQSLKTLSSDINKHKFQLLFMHHHAIDVGYFIDKHGLVNKAQFWQTINKHKASIKGIACGHVHQALSFFPADVAKTVEGKTEVKVGSNVESKIESKSTEHCVPLYTCPATSIQFDPSQPNVSALNQPPAYRLFTLFSSGEISTKIVVVDTTVIDETSREMSHNG